MERHQHERNDDSRDNRDHVVARNGFEGLHRVALHGGKKIDDPVTEKGAE